MIPGTISLKCRVAFAVSLIVLTCQASATEFPGAENLDEVTLQLRWYHQFQFAGYYAAIEQGYYEEVGLKVNLVEGGLSHNTVNEVATGLAQYGVSNAEILLHRLRGAKLVVLAAVFQHSPLVLVSLKEKQISTPQQLVGRQVAMTLESRDIELQAMFRAEGIEMSDVRIVDKLSVRREDYFNASIDAVSAYITNQPFYYEQRGIDYTILHPRTYGIDFYGDCLFTSEKELEDNPERVKAFREASLRGWAYAMNHVDEMVDIISTKYNSKKTRAHLLYEADAMQSLILPDLVKIGHMNPGRWHHIAQTFQRFGLIKGDYSLEGFIYAPDSKVDVRKLYWTIAAITVVGVLISLFTLLLLMFNRRLQKEIGERKLAQAEIARERDFAAAVLKWIESIVVVVDLEGYLVSFNLAAEKCSGYTLQEVQRQPFWNILVPEEERESVREVILNVRSKALPNENENHWVSKSGQKRLIHWFNSVLKDSGGNAEFILCTGLDLTERSQMEDVLESREKHYSILFENMEEGYFEVDLEGTMLRLNSSLARILGYERGELVGLNYREYMDRETADRVFAMYNRIFKSGKSESYLSYRVIRKDGDRRTLEVSVSLSRDSSGKAVGFHGIIRDATDRKRMEELMVQSEKMISMGGLAAGMAHEINNPLGAMTALAQTIERRFSLDLSKNREVAERIGVDLSKVMDYAREQEIGEYLTGIRDAGGRAAGIIRNMLDFSRKSESTFEDCSASELLDKAIELASSDYDLKKSFDFKSIRIEKEYQEDLPAIKVIRTEIEQVILNLLKNSAQAIKSKSFNKDVPALTLRTAREEDRVRIEVEDNGPGMDEETRKRVFEPFFYNKGGWHGHRSWFIRLLFYHNQES